MSTNFKRVCIGFVCGKDHADAICECGWPIVVDSPDVLVGLSETVGEDHTRSDEGLKSSVIQTNDFVVVLQST